MKKKILTIGTLGISIVPVIALVSCGASKDADNENLMKSLSFLKNGLFVDSDDFSPITKTSSIPLREFLKENRKIKPGEYIEVKQDRVILASAYYTGKIQNISTIYKNNPTAFTKMQSSSNFEYIAGSAILPERNQTIRPYNSYQPVIQMGAKDSLIYVFDKDDNDGRSLYGFKKQIMFEDSSIAHIPIVDKINGMIGLKQEPITRSFSRIPFIGSRNKGVLTSYYGSQNNHQDAKRINANSKDRWDQVKLHLKSIFPEKIANNIINYYNNASRKFIPTEVPFGYIKYEVIGPNAIKVDFSNRPNVTAAHIGKVSKDGTKFSWDAELSIGGPEEWKAYDRNEVSTGSNRYLIIGKH